MVWLVDEEVAWLSFYVRMGFGQSRAWLIYWTEHTYTTTNWATPRLTLAKSAKYSVHVTIKLDTEENYHTIHLIKTIHINIVSICFNNFKLFYSASTKLTCQLSNNPTCAGLWTGLNYSCLLESRSKFQEQSAKIVIYHSPKWWNIMIVLIRGLPYIHGAPGCRSCNIP